MLKGIIEAGDIFIHTKSGIRYEIVCVSFNVENDKEENLDPVISYKKFNSPEQNIYHRRISNFLALVKKNPDSKHNTIIRFTKVIS